MDHFNEIARYVNGAAFRKKFGLPEKGALELSLLAQGEYHKNYIFTHPITAEKYVLRVNYGSQMHLENQIEYEYAALKLLEDSGRTPVPVYVDGSQCLIPQGLLIMKYIEGKPLSYQTDLREGARCLADVHCTPISHPEKLIEIKDPIHGILAECEEMFAVYRHSEFAIEKKVQTIEALMKLAYKKAKELSVESSCSADKKAARYQNVCINTELNNHNFLVNRSTGKVSLIDWEKPLWGDPAQDLGHMLAPTTTFWRTDHILDQEVTEQFLDDYIAAVAGRIRLGDLKKRVHVFLPVTCLRGITWCAMAYVEYSRPGRKIANPETFSKLEAYLSDEFLEKIRKFLLI